MDKARIVPGLLAEPRSEAQQLWRYVFPDPPAQE
jgi:hypothetical protein